jgi:glycosyltransferase involved in cell wall biosynthesis
VHLVYVGAISEQDGADALPETIARLRALDPPIQAALTIVGDGDGRRHVEAAAERYGVADAVSITGWIEPDRVRAFIEDADICVDPAPSTPLNERSTMIKLAEYLALGKPVVAYDLLETRRTVGDAAVLVPSGDAGAFATAIAELAGDGSRRTELSAQARERSHALTWDHSAAALLRAYTALCPLPLDGSSALRPAEPEQPAQVSAVAES